MGLIGNDTCQGKVNKVHLGIGTRQFVDVSYVAVSSYICVLVTSFTMSTSFVRRQSLSVVGLRIINSFQFFIRTTFFRKGIRVLYHGILCANVHSWRVSSTGFVLPLFDILDVWELDVYDCRDWCWSNIKKDWEDLSFIVGVFLFWVFDK